MELEELEERAYKTYTGSEEEVTLDGEKYSAYFPKNHSRVKGIVLHSYNANAWDTWANIPDYRTICHVLWKGSKEWKKEYEGRSRDFDIRGEEINVGAFDGIYPILFGLESDEVKDEFLKKHEIRCLKERIKSDSKRLEELIKA